MVLLIVIILYSQFVILQDVMIYEINNGLHSMKSSNNSNLGSKEKLKGGDKGKRPQSHARNKSAMQSKNSYVIVYCIFEI